jgi:hypothetical protein
MSKTPEEKVALMEKAYGRWLLQRKSSIDDLGFDPIHPFFAGWTMGFDDNFSVYRNNQKVTKILFLVFGMLLGITI